jgi:hypothetical protein
MARNPSSNKAGRISGRRSDRHATKVAPESPMFIAHHNLEHELTIYRCGGEGCSEIAIVIKGMLVCHTSSQKGQQIDFLFG